MEDGSDDWGHDISGLGSDIVLLSHDTTHETYDSDHNDDDLL